MAALKFKEIMCILYSFCLFISGVLLIGFSVFLSYKLFYYYKFVPSSSIGPFIFLFLLGFLHLFITWLAIKGPTREHDFHIILFIIITIILLVIECAIGIWSMILWDEVDLESAQLMSDSFNKLIKYNNTIEENYWEQFERELKCCGFNGVHEYNKIPLSCCNENINATCITYEYGCKKPFTRYLKKLLIDAAIMGFVCCLMQAIGVFTFYKFFKGLKQERSARIARRLAIQQRNLSQESGGTTAPQHHPAVVPTAPQDAPPVSSP